MGESVLAVRLGVDKVGLENDKKRLAGALVNVESVRRQNNLWHIVGGFAHRKQYGYEAKQDRPNLGTDRCGSSQCGSFAHGEKGLAVRVDHCLGHCARHEPDGRDGPRNQHDGCAGRGRSGGHYARGILPHLALEQARRSGLIGSDVGRRRRVVNCAAASPQTFQLP